MYSSLIYYLICFSGLSGGALLLWESNRKKIIKAGRWRIRLDHYHVGRLPFYRAYRQYAEKRRQSRTDLEIYEAISFMRNVTIVGEGGKLNADTLLEQLILNKGNLAPVYAKTLQMLRQNQKVEAIEYFSIAAGTKISDDFIRLLMQWDDIEPEQLLETLLSHQKSVREARYTVRKRRDELISDLIYLPVVMNVMLVFINFIYIGYYIDQREMLTMLL